MIADVVEALMGAFLSTGSEIAALSFMAWLGIDVDFANVPYTRNLPVNPEFHVNVKYFESLPKYRFLDVSLLVEALTHGSYMLPEIPRYYKIFMQRLEFLGDAVLDYLITTDLYNKYPGLSPGLLTDLRSASTNNDFYAQSAVKKLEDDLANCGLTIGKHESDLKMLKQRQSTLQRHISDLQALMVELDAPSTFGKECIEQTIESRGDFASAFVCKLRKLALEQRPKDILGVVALLGSVQTIELSKLILVSMNLELVNSW